MQVLVYICKKICKVTSGQNQLPVTSSKNFGTNQSVEMDWITVEQSVRQSQLKYHMTYRTHTVLPQLRHDLPTHESSSISSEETYSQTA